MKKKKTSKLFGVCLFQAGCLQRLGIKTEVIHQVYSDKDHAKILIQEEFVGLFPLLDASIYLAGILRGVKLGKAVSRH